MTDTNQQLHRYMLVFNATFVGPQGQPGFKSVTSVISRNKKNVPLEIIKRAQDGVAMQLTMFGIEPENIVDVAFQNCSYLGHMTEKEFIGSLDNDAAANVELYGSKQVDTKKKNPFEIQ